MTENSDPAKVDGSALVSTDRSLPFALIRAREKVVQPYRSMLMGADVSEQQWRVLRVLYETGEMEANRVAEKATLFMSSMTRIAQKLVKKGLISRRLNPTDRRRLFFDITAAGRRVIDDQAPKSLELANKFRDCYGQEKLDNLLDLLSDLNNMDS